MQLCGVQPRFSQQLTQHPAYVGLNPADMEALELASGAAVTLRHELHTVHRPMQSRMPRVARGSAYFPAAGDVGPSAAFGAEVRLERDLEMPRMSTVLSVWGTLPFALQVTIESVVKNRHDPGSAALVCGLSPLCGAQDYWLHPSARRSQSRRSQKDGCSRLRTF